MDVVEQYLTLENVHKAVKFAGVLSAGIYTGGSVFLYIFRIPSVLAMRDMDQALMQFRLFWPAECQLLFFGALTGVLGIGSYLVKRDANDLPWLMCGVFVTFHGPYAFKFLYPQSIGPLRNPNLLKEKDESYVRNMFKQFLYYQTECLLAGVVTFVTFTYCYGFK